MARDITVVVAVIAVPDGTAISIDVHEGDGHDRADVVAMVLPHLDSLMGGTGRPASRPSSIKTPGCGAARIGSAHQGAHVITASSSRMSPLFILGFGILIRRAIIAHLRWMRQH